MTPEEYLQEKNRKPTYSVMEVLRSLHSEEMDKAGVYVLMDVVLDEIARYKNADLCIINSNCDMVIDQLNLAATTESEARFLARVQELKTLING